MLHLLLKLSVLLVTLIATAAGAAPLPVPKPPAVGARSYLLQDHMSGRVLAEKAADQRMEPASITKMMSAYVIFKELKSGSIRLEDQVTVSEKAWRMPGSRMFIEVGKKVSVEDLIKGMIVQSGNDATVALAEHVAGSEDSFADYMNRYAEELGLTGSHFSNATGLPDPEHYTTARDIARIARALIHEFPEYYAWYSQKSFTFNGITQHNRNKLLWRDPTVDGIKTGHTDAAGYCLVTSALRDGMRLISVVLGTKSEEARADASQALLNYGFRFFETHKLYDAGTPLTQARVWKGAREQLPLGLAETLYVTIPRGRYQELQAGMRLPNTLIAPVSAGQPLGSVQIRLGDELVAEQPLVALESIPEGSFWQRALDEAMLYFEN
ncbi:D-alanyl-D-alanine carboxypeptidase family protein [Thiohalobacter sp. IOR34]|uniref:D-alanyl-D-alanine carboxypeptidase family protein n=1 Tax=Thiohalobacter sp. IOR34 TaxID=3057176 RepID=UPI0025AFC9C0|nr:D-alanyl-D-alanine carboxypeptidase family protein [Thiohalobacter sp. IOR34]WJW75927.1 D-alanyl-D-alanine carboxypeptidase family protein [Thiohalobacter sp. IOR34]